MVAGCCTVHQCMAALWQHCLAQRPIASSAHWWDTVLLDGDLAVQVCSFAPLAVFTVCTWHLLLSHSCHSIVTVKGFLRVLCRNGMVKRHQYPVTVLSYARCCGVWYVHQDWEYTHATDVAQLMANGARTGTIVQYKV
jgi:hypothetical protein